MNPDASTRWSFVRDAVFDLVTAPDPTLDANGNIYVALDTLYSFDYDGKLRWKTVLDRFVVRSLVSDLDGTVYFAVKNDLYDREFDAISAQGILAWSWLFDSFQSTGPSPAISADGRLILPTWRSTKLYAFRQLNCRHRR